jgi:glutamate-5-semialdehyde dehydrogenase
VDLESHGLETARALALRARSGARALSTATREQKDRALLRMAELLVEQEPAILEANRRDIERAAADGLATPLIDRLRLDRSRIEAMQRGLTEVAALPDPVGEETEHWSRPNGMRVSRVRIPLGVILMIYEARPNVTVDAAALCIKSGNAAILRGGKEALRSNEMLAGLLRQALESAGLPGDACVFVADTNRALMLALLKQEELIDLAIPRGGEGLIRFVVEHARVPVIKHYKGVCHLYVDAAADVEMAVELAFNSKVSRPGVCNALECLLVHESIASRLLPAIGKRLGEAGVEFHAESKAGEWLAGTAGKVVPAQPDDFGQEFLDLTLAVKVVASYEEATGHIAQYGSLHTECIVTEDPVLAARFTRDVEASMVGWNVSTRFNDGGALGLGAEMGISTTKLHAFGPMGLQELTTRKFVVQGQGQVRV